MVGACTSPHMAARFLHLNRPFDASLTVLATPALPPLQPPPTLPCLQLSRTLTSGKCSGHATMAPTPTNTQSAPPAGGWHQLSAAACLPTCTPACLLYHAWEQFITRYPAVHLCQANMPFLAAPALLMPCPPPACICSKVQVVYVRPEEQPPANCEFWWSFGERAAGASWAWLSCATREGCQQALDSDDVSSSQPPPPNRCRGLRGLAAPPCPACCFPLLRSLTAGSGPYRWPPSPAAPPTDSLPCPATPRCPCCVYACFFFRATAEFDRRFLTFEVPAEVARQQRAKFLATRKPETPVVSLSACTLED